MSNNKNLSDFVFWAVCACLAVAITKVSGPRADMEILIYAVMALLAMFVWYLMRASRERKQRALDAESRQTVLIEEMHVGFERINKKVDKLASAQQTTMRATLIHNAEKYFERGWLTPEEQASWCDMHDRYSDLGANGLIQTYREKINNLPHRLLD